MDSKELIKILLNVLDIKDTKGNKITFKCLPLIKLPKVSHSIDVNDSIVNEI